MIFIFLALIVIAFILNAIDNSYVCPDCDSVLIPVERGFQGFTDWKCTKCGCRSAYPETEPFGAIRIKE